MKAVDKFLNGITMYRLLAWGLRALIAGGLIFSYLHRLPFTPLALALSTLVLISSCYIANRALGIIYDTPTNSESWRITALILACILPPSSSVHELFLLAGAGAIAMGVKFILVYHHKHFFNPAAFAAVILGLFGVLSAIWWVGSPSMLPLTIIFGILVLRKIRRFQLFGSFLVASLVVSATVGLHNNQGLSSILQIAFKSSPLIFLGSIMLTEPESSPPHVWQQRIYGAIVGFIFSSQLHVGSVSTTPEIALILGNIYAYAMSPKYKLRMHLVAIRQLAPKIFDLSFTANHVLDFKPGQYMEWTLPGTKWDNRGNRRTFSIASAPGTHELHIAVKTYEPSSVFKKALLKLKPGDYISAGQLAGDFILPENTNQKLAFIAGGIGITPFVSMIEDLINTKQKRDIVLLYFTSDPAEYCYEDIWKKAASQGVRVVPFLSMVNPPKSWGGKLGRLSEATLKAEVSDFTERRFYVSGPNALVESYGELLCKMHVKRKDVVTDHFSGY